MLANDIDYVIGVNTHKDSHSAALLNAIGGVISAVDVTASEVGYRRLLALAKSTSGWSASAIAVGAATPGLATHRRRRVNPGRAAVRLPVGQVTPTNRLGGPDT